MVWYKVRRVWTREAELPITEEQCDWIDRSCVRLGSLVGAHRLFEAELMLPTPQHFPDRYDRSEAALQRMFHRIAARMHVNPAEVEVTLFASENDLTNSLVPFYSSRGREQPSSTTTTQLQAANFNRRISDERSDDAGCGHRARTRARHSAAT